jgi:hypothetical protein
MEKVKKCQNGFAQSVKLNIQVDVDKLHAQTVEHPKKNTPRRPNSWCH